MVATKITTFKGTKPRISPELLPDTNAQIARNCKLYSGDLIPYPEPVAVGNSGRLSGTRTIYPLRDPNTDDLVWLTWDGVVDVATPSFTENVDEQKFYYTDGVRPKVSTYELAVSGSAPYPNDYYYLGLPLPDTAPVATASNFSTATITSISRAADGTATFNTSAAHGLRTGMYVSTTGFTYITGTYNKTTTTNTVTINNHGLSNGATVYLTKTSGTMTDGAYTISNVTTNTFDVIDPVSGATSGSLQLDMRSYTSGSTPVTKVDSDTVTAFLPGFPQSTYTISSTSLDLSGPVQLRSYVYTWYTPWGEESIPSDPSNEVFVREGQTVTISSLPTAPPSGKNFVRGMRLYRTLAGVEDGSYVLLATLWFPQNTASVAHAGFISTVTMQEPHNFLVGDAFYLVGCTDSAFDTTNRVYSIIDQFTFTYIRAGAEKATTADTTGVLYHNVAETPDSTPRYWGQSSYNFTDDFLSQNLTVSLPSENYSPPPDALQGLKLIQNNIMVGFVRNKLYISEPNLPHAWPEDYEKVFDKNIVAVEPLSGVGALVLTEGYPYIISGSDPRSMSVQRVDALYPCLSAQGVVAMSYGILYPTHEGLAFYNSGTGPKLITAPIFEQDTWSTTLDPTTIVAEYYGDAYFASHSTGSFVYQYDDQGGSFVECDQKFTAAYNEPTTNVLYFSDGTNDTIYQWDDLAQPKQVFEWKSKVVVTRDFLNMGAARIIADWDDIPNNVTFTFYVNKTQVYSQTVTNSDVFRLPSGYRSDTFEFKVTGDIRIRAVHLGETPLSLKEA